MTGSTRRFLGGCAILVACYGTAAVSAGQNPAPPSMAEQVFTNVQVLRGIPVDEFLLTMGFYSTATGLNCTDCHVEESGGSWARYADDNELKRQARRMQLMTNNINRGMFGGRQVVTCDTCHRGFSRPHVMPSINRLYGAPPPDEPGDPIEQAVGQPSPDTVFDKYLAALGTPQQLAALTSLAAKGTYMGFDDADTSEVEMLARSTGERTTVVHTPLGDSTTTITPNGGWIAAPPTDKPVPLMQITGQELDGVRVEAMVFFPSTLRKALTSLRTGLPQVLEDDREVLQVQGNTASGGTVTLLIDAETNLLRRLVRYNESPVGRLVSRVDYHEYREVAGVKIPSRWTVSWVSGRSQFALTDVQANVPIPPQRFARPNLPQTLLP